MSENKFTLTVSIQCHRLIPILYLFCVWRREKEEEERERRERKGERRGGKKEEIKFVLLNLFSN